MNIIYVQVLLDWELGKHNCCHNHSPLLTSHNLIQVIIRSFPILAHVIKSIFAVRSIVLMN